MSKLNPCIHCGLLHGQRFPTAPGMVSPADPFDCIDVLSSGFVFLIAALSHEPEAVAKFQGWIDKHLKGT